MSQTQDCQNLELVYENLANMLISDSGRTQYHLLNLYKISVSEKSPIFL